MATEELGGGFRVIELESPQFKSAAWSAGQKVQIAVGPKFTYRTYTPTEWDGARGRTWIIAYAHGEGPGSDWVRKVKAGDACEVFGPRASLHVSAMNRPVLLFGDETSLGIGTSIRQTTAATLRCVFEVNSSNATRPAVEAFGIVDAELFERSTGDAHLAEIERLIGAQATSDATFVLTGKATSIQRLRGALKRHGVPGGRVMTKAYWAPGKKGLD